MPRTRKTGNTEKVKTSETAEQVQCPVCFADDAFGAGADELAAMLRSAAGTDSPRMLLVADSNVVQRTERLGTNIGKFVREKGIGLAGAPVIMNGGEKAKLEYQQSVQRVAAAAVDGQIGDGDIMVVIGGGSVFDIAGYAAAHIRGGIPVVRIPTTVASMVDGAFAAYAAVNIPSAKDAMRVPCRPAGVVIDTAFASTVLDGVWRGGIGELVRFSATTDAALFEKIAGCAAQLKNRDAALMAQVVRDCVKSRILAGGNSFSLWSAAQLEAMSAYKLPHGYAVPIAICIDSAYSAARGLIGEFEQDAVCGVLRESGALDGLSHSLYLLGQADSILKGLDTWKLLNGSPAIQVMAGIGKLAVDEEPDRELLRKVLNDFNIASRRGGAS